MRFGQKAVSWSTPLVRGTAGVVICVLTLAIGLAGRGSSAPAPPPSAPEPGPVRFCESPETYVLPNGIEVTLREDHSLPAIAVVSSVHVGSRHDPQGYEGLAHYVEHLTFRAGPAKLSSDELDASIGATDRNAFTRPDTTDYFSVVPPEQLERALWIEARRLAVGLDTVAQEQALAEREVILREQVERIGGGSALTTRDAINRALYPEGHPYRKVSPSKDSQGQLTLEAARWFFARHYRPDHTRLIILGDFKSDEAKALVARLFGDLPARAAAPRSGDRDLGEECRIAALPSSFVPARVVVRTPERRETLLFVWPVPFGEQGAASLGPLNLLAGRIEIATRDAKLGDKVTHGLNAFELGQFLWLEVAVIPGRSFESAAAVVRAEIARFEQERPSKEMIVARRQAAELGAVREQSRMIDRALRLARRECSPTPCFEPATQMTPATYSHLDRFDPRHALVVERRFSGLAPREGSVEVVTAGGAP